MFIYSQFIDSKLKDIQVYFYIPTKKLKHIQLD